jgi:hypothetical protein
MKIVQDLLPNNYKVQLQKVLFGIDFPWYWQDNAKGATEESNIFQLTHIFVKHNVANSDYFKLIDPMFDYIKESTGLVGKEIYRVKANLLPRQVCNDDDIAKEIHIDVDRGDLTSCIYYLHDVDGDIKTYDKNYNVVDSYSPKENSLVYFNSNTLHGTRPPIQSKRRVCINFILGTQ